MGLKSFRPFTPSRRKYTSADFVELTPGSEPERSLIAKMSRSGGRNHYGRQTNRNMGGGHKRRYRIIDFKRDNDGIEGVVASVQYDPNRAARIALVNYRNGDKRYVIAPVGLKAGDKISCGENAEVKTGNALPIRVIPTGQAIHNIELHRGAGAQLVRGAGTSAQLVAKEGEYALIRLPSGEMRKIHVECRAVIGVVSNPDHINIDVGKAGRSRWLNRRPHNRGITKNPVDHAMGGRTNGGRHPCSPYGIPAKGFKTRSNKRTNKFIVRSRGKSVVA